MDFEPAADAREKRPARVSLGCEKDHGGGLFVQNGAEDTAAGERAGRGNGGAMLHRTDSLRANSDFKRLYNRGKSFVAPELVLYLMKTRRPVNRIGITVSKKVGNAVVRNRARRVIREAYRLLLPELRSFGFDMVFVARQKTARVSCVSVTSAMRELFVKAGILG